MAEVLKGNGSQESIKDTHAQKLSEEIQKELWAIFKVYQKNESILTPDEFYRTVALVFMHCSAVIAVDCHLSYVQFLGMAKKLHDDSVQRAPKFS